MDRLFGHQVFIALVAATVAVGLVPPLVEDWSRRQEEAAAQRALDCAEAMQDGGVRAAAGDRRAGETPGSRLTLLLLLVPSAVLLWLGGAALRRRLRSPEPWTRSGSDVAARPDCGKNPSRVC